MKIKTTDKTVHSVFKKMDNRSIEGNKTYKNSMHDEVELGIKGFNDFVDDTQEELMDAILYLESAKKCNSGYSIYHLLDTNKVGLAKDIIDRVETQQGYSKGEYAVLVSHIPNLEHARLIELMFQKEFKSPVEDHHNDIVDIAILKKKKQKIDFGALDIKLGSMYVTKKGITVTFPCKKQNFKEFVKEQSPITIVNGASSLTFRDKADTDWLINNVFESGYNDGKNCYIYWKAANKHFSLKH